MAIPIIDIFAGPGGLGEGFCALQDEAGERAFKIVLSIEKDEQAHQTLTLRSFFRQFRIGDAPEDYYEFVKGDIKLEDLYRKWPLQAKTAKNEAWLATLGRVRKKRKTLNEKKDERVGLYKQYLRILALHSPSVFVMENVRGLLTAKTKDSPVFTKILKDLSDPVSAYRADFTVNGQELLCPGYKIYSLVKKSKGPASNGHPTLLHKDYLIKSENHGIPQTRHRVILLGIRNDIDFVSGILKEQKKVSVSAIGYLWS